MNLVEVEVAPTLESGVNRTGGTRPSGSTVDTAASLIPTVAWALQERDAKGPDSDTKPGHLIPVQAWCELATATAVRRLTPTECERLQGFPDGWTCLDVPLEDWARDPEAAAERCQCPDSPRYRMMGNAVAVNVITWLGHRLMAAVTASRETRSGDEGA